MRHLTHHEAMAIASDLSGHEVEDIVCASSYFHTCATRLSEFGFTKASGRFRAVAQIMVAEVKARYRAVNGEQVLGEMKGDIS